MQDQNKHLEALLGQAYQILNSSGSMTDESDRINELLEKIISLRIEKNDIQQVFDNMGEVATSMMMLDFSKRVSLPYTFDKEQNMFNYMAMLLNSLNEELGARVVSKKITDVIIDDLSDSAIVIVTDQQGLISFVHGKLGNIPGFNKNRILKKPINGFFKDFSAINEKRSGKGKIKDMPVALSDFSQDNSHAIKLLTVSEMKNPYGEVEYIVYTLKEPQKPLISKSKEAKELERLTGEYRSLWKFWMDEGLKLSNEEVLSLKYYLDHRSHNVLARELGLTEQQICDIYQNALDKLNVSLNNYNKWIINKAIEIQENDREMYYWDLSSVPKEIPDNTNISKDIDGILKEYGKHWNSWIELSGLFSAWDGMVIDYVLNFGSHKALAQQLNIKPESASKAGKRTIEKLRYSIQRYHAWIISRALIIHKKNEEGKVITEE